MRQLFSLSLLLLCSPVAAQLTLSIHSAAESPRTGQKGDQAWAERLERSLKEDCLGAWYPRTLDERFGGYVSRFDANWNPSGNQEKFIVSQARHVWATGQLGLFTGEASYGELSLRGARYLAATMWDEERGGFHDRVTQEGTPMRERGKSAYGNAFAIYGLASCYASTGDEASLELAKKAFRWLERFSWDAEHGGYVDRMTTEGSWAGESRGKGLSEPFRHVGLKDYNSTIHLLEAFTALYQQWPDERLKARLEFLLELTRDRFVTEPGYLQLYFFRDWTPVSFQGQGRAFVRERLPYDHVSWGHDVETAFLMLEAAHALGREGDARTMEVAKRLVDHALATGWDEEAGGLYESGYYFDPQGPCETLRKTKVWWVAAESLNAFLMMSQLYPDESRYRSAFEKQWAYCEQFLIDHQRGGWYEHGLDRTPEAQDWPKAHEWKTSYHVARAYLNCIQMLRGAFPLTRR